ncbi:MAG TPA: hypothetical protein VMB52_00330 [Verrucomicrobiae bacterium]|nr:hypothetical protein [Verrucomicrobiae bacterium]
MKSRTLHRKLHPIHWHSSMLLAVAAILLTSIKCSSGMLRALQAVPTPNVIAQDIFLRDPETEHTPIIIDVGTRHAAASGK